MDVDEVAQSIVISEGEARLLVRMLWPEGLRMTQTNQFDAEPLDNAPNQWHLTAGTIDKAPRAHFLSALVPYRAGEDTDAPRITMLDCEGGFAVQLESDSGRDIVAFRVDPAEQLRAADIETDMRVVAVRRTPGGDIRSVFARGGTTLRIGGAEHDAVD
jgi:hypothetical protein